jgi:hypothetical protein
LEFINLPGAYIFMAFAVALAIYGSRRNSAVLRVIDVVVSVCVAFAIGQMAGFHVGQQAEEWTVVARPHRAAKRRSLAALRLAAAHRAACACGEKRPFALISGRSPPICFRCERLAHGRGPYEDNHVFGKRNSALTIRYPINDHRALLSVKQYRWPPGALENPSSSPLLEGVARMHGAYDNIEHMLAENREFSAKLARLEEQLTTLYGPNWPDKLEAAAVKKRAKLTKAAGRPFNRREGRS